MKAIILLIALSTTGCVPVIAGMALRDHGDRKWQEMEYRHKEKMRELDIQERTLKQNAPQQSNGAIVRDNPY